MKLRSIVKGTFKAFVFILLAVILVTAVGAAGIYGAYYGVVSEGPGQLAVRAKPDALGRLVNPFSGTGGIYYVCGHNFPGATAPFGMMRLGPDTASLFVDRKALNTSGYYYPDNKILGFSHTRLLGTGATDGGQFRVLPMARPRKAGEVAPALYFSHARETAFPGYYAVRLPKPGVLVELTATERAGLHRYSFDAGAQPCLTIDVTSALGNRNAREGEVRLLPGQGEIEGAARNFGSFSGRNDGLKAYFVARFSEPFVSYGCWNGADYLAGEDSATGEDIAVEVTFEKMGVPRPVEMQIGLSFVSIENARANLDAEIGSADFEGVLARTKAAWEEKLGRIKIAGGTREQERIFYTALYRSFQMPTVFNDVNGEYLGFDKEIHKVEAGRYFTDMSIWDTFRTVHPLYMLIAPEDQRDMLRSLTAMVEQGGWLPRWPSGAGYSNSMLGTPGDMIIAESYLKGFRDFDVETVYQAMRKVALEPMPEGARFSGREGIEHYIQYGYCPAEMMREAVARTLEFAYADDAVARLAEALGHEEDAKLFREHAQFYRNLWNPETQYFQPRNSDGQFVEAFKPDLLTYLDDGGKYTNDYVEGSAMQWRWAVPFDPQGLISLFKDRDFFVSELNDFFALSDPAMGAWNPGPYYWHGNEPDLYAAYLFNEAGRPDLTQKWVRWILDNKYADTYYGLDGNDDAGTLSAWYVFSALGFYPLAGSDVYQLGAPLFEKAELNLGGKLLTILAENHARDNIYVQKVTINGTPLDRWWIRHNEIADGGTLTFTMGPEPAMKAKNLDNKP